MEVLAVFVVKLHLADRNATNAARASYIKINYGIISFFPHWSNTMKLASFLPILCLFAACDPKPAPAVADKAAALGAGNSVRCVVDSLKLTGSGPDAVGLASFGIQGGKLTAFGISLNIEHGGKVHVVSTSLMALPLQAGTYHFPALDTAGMTFASYEVRTKDRDLLRDYNGATYSQHYSPVENDPEAKLNIVVDKLALSAADLPGFQRVHAVGRFQFNGAALPGAEPSETCVKDGIQRSFASLKAGKRMLPLFDAAVCGAEKKHVQCEFDVSGDFITHPTQ